jgi:tetratricopeptide (TPR) repeat protein
MIPTPAKIVFLLPLFALVILSCKSEDESPLSPEADSRLWVKAALDKIDRMQLGVTFNEERAAILKARMEQEKNPVNSINLGQEYAYELLKCGKTKESLAIFHALTNYIEKNKISIAPIARRNLYSMIGIAFMRHGEIENCLQNHNHESCFLPIKGGGIHELPYGSRNAIVAFERCLKEFPDDLETRYLLNLAYMTLGEYPDKVPLEYRIDTSWFQSKVKIQPFHDVAAQLGVNRNGLAGGTVVDDFTNDGWLDIVIISWGPKDELIFYVNNGDGTFTDQTAAFGLSGHVGILNLNHTDYNNDGWLDLYLMRGAWYQQQGDIPNTLLKNTGKGKFVDVTLKAGVTHVAPTQSSAWADFNLDGWLDLVVANESLPQFERGIDLYINQKDGTFKHESGAYGLTQNQFFKGCVAADVNNDRYPDIYISALDAQNSLLINEGKSGKQTFTNVTNELNVGAPIRSFPCWSFDYNNDGNEDLFVSAYSNEGTPATHWMLSQMGQADPAMLPKLYRNNGNMTFDEVGIPMGLTEVAFTMGCNFGDINTDGFLDFYLSTGNPLYQSLVPNKMYLNMEGQRFEDVSFSGGFANIQKGHGVGFGDLDHDGDEDLYVVIGGAVDGDRYFNCLFENPNENQNNWVVLKLEGTTCNKPAVGARVVLSVQENGQERKIYRTVTSGASFGANSLILEVGLRKANSINQVSVQWPCKDCPDQTFTGLEINKAYTLTEGKSNPENREYGAVKFSTTGSSHHH